MMAPDHLTPIGAVLWQYLPRWVKTPVSAGWTFKGIRLNNNTLAAGILVDWYHGYCPHQGIRYWRKQIWIAGRPVATWKLPPNTKLRRPEWRR